MPINRSLNVGLVFDDSLDSLNGVAQYVKALGAWLSDQGHQVSYLVGETKLKDWAGGPVYSLAKNQQVTFNGNKMSVPLPAHRQEIQTILQQNQYDVLHVMVPYSPFMAQKVINQAGSQTVIIGTFHIYPSGQLAELGSRGLRLWYGRSLARFESMISVSSAAAEFAKRAFRVDSKVIPNPINLKFFKPPANVKPTPNRIVFLGRLVKRKGVRQLLEAFARLVKDCPEARLVIAGDGPQFKELKALSRRLRISQFVDFRGFVSEDQKPAILASAEIACFPSLYGESFGIVLIEAMAARAGVVTGGNNPGYESVLGERSELLFDPTNKTEMADRLRTLLTDSDLRTELHSWQQAEVKKYDINVVGAQIEAEYYQAIARLTKNSHNKAHE